MRRWLGHVGAGLMLLIAASAVFAWVRSSTVSDVFYSPHVEEEGDRIVVKQMMLTTGLGRMSVARVVQSEERQNGSNYQLYPFHRAQEPYDPFVKFGYGPEPKLGFLWHHIRLEDGLHERRPTSFWQLVVPFWFIVLVTLPPPVVWFWGIARRRRRTKRGLCHTCGYDLRASEGRCPECGAEIVRTSAVSGEGATIARQA